jgi:hypothetical protein
MENNTNGFSVLNVSQAVEPTNHVRSAVKTKPATENGSRVTTRFTTNYEYMNKKILFALKKNASGNYEISANDLLDALTESMSQAPLKD